MFEFKIEIAGVPAEVKCRFRENMEFLRDYLTGKEPLFTVQPSEGDLRQMQKDFYRMDEIEGFPPHRREERFLENNALHAVLAERLTEHDVLLMHGSALCMDGEGVIFTAKSGTGKSTHSRLWREVYGDRVFMVNDDKPFLKVTESGVFACGSPWNGKHHLSRNVCVPLRAIVSLERGKDNRIEPMSNSDAFPVLIKQAYMSREPGSMQRIMALEKALIDKVTFYKMSCNMEHDAAVMAYNKVFAR